MIIRMFQYGFRKGKENADYGGDFHSMLLAIQNLIEYLNRNYIDDENLEKEVNIMTKSLYDPEVEKKGIEKGIEKNQAEIVLNMLGEGLDEATIFKIH